MSTVVSPANSSRILATTTICLPPKLSFYASPDESARPSIPDGSPLPTPPANHAMQDFAHTTFEPATDTDGNSPMSPPLSDSSPPPDYFSAFTPYNDVPSPLTPPHGEFEHRLNFDFASSCMSADINGNGDFDTHQFSELMGIVPDAYGSVCSAPPSDCDGHSRLSSPLPFADGAPSPASDTHNSSPSESTSPSSSNSPFPSAHATFIAASGTPPPPPCENDRPADSAPSKTGRRAQYPCLHPTCDRVLTSPYTRQVHMGTHKAKVRKAFLCTLGCEEAFTREHDRQRHEVALHGKKCKHVCARCKRFFSSAKMLDRHVCRGRRQGSIQWPLGDEEEVQGGHGNSRLLIEAVSRKDP